MPKSKKGRVAVTGAGVLLRTAYHQPDACQLGFCTLHCMQMHPQSWPCLAIGTGTTGAIASASAIAQCELTSPGWGLLCGVGCRPGVCSSAASSASPPGPLLLACPPLRAAVCSQPPVPCPCLRQQPPASKQKDLALAVLTQADRPCPCLFFFSGAAPPS